MSSSAQLDAAAGERVCAGSSDPTVPGKVLQGLSPRVLLKGNPPQFPRAFCFSGAHGLGLDTDPESATLRVHLTSKCTACRWGLLCWNCWESTTRYSLSSTYCCQTPPAYLDLCFNRAIQKGKKEYIWEKKTAKKIKFLAFFLLLGKQLRENMVM